MPNHLERLVAEWLELQGYVVYVNALAGKRKGGGYEAELDILAFNPLKQHLLHVETSMDAESWESRDKKFSRKFLRGSKYFNEIIEWLPDGNTVERWAILPASDKNRSFVGDITKECARGAVYPLKKLYADIASDERLKKDPLLEAVPEKFPLLRTIQNVLWWTAPVNGKRKTGQTAK